MRKTLIFMILILLSSVNAFYFENVSSSGFNSSWTQSGANINNGILDVGSNDWANFNLSDYVGDINGSFNMTFQAKTDGFVNCQSGGWNNDDGGDTTKRTGIFFFRTDPSIKDAQQNVVNTYVAGQWYNFTLVNDEDNRQISLWMNETLESTVAYSNNLGTHYINFYCWGGTLMYVRNIDIYNESLSGGAPPPVVTLNISNPLPTSSTYLNDAQVNFNATVNSDTNYSCSYYINGSLNSTTFYINTTNTISQNITFKERGHYNYTLSCQNNVDSDNYSAIIYLNASEPTLTFSNYIEHNSNNYTRNLTYLLNITNCGTNNTIYRYINNVLTLNETIVCTTTNNTILRNYSHSANGLFNISFYIESQRGYLSSTYNFTNQEFLSDITKPVIHSFTYSMGEGFSKSSPWLNLTMMCNDSAYNQTQYYLNIGGNSLIGNYSNNKYVSHNASSTQGQITLTGQCSDLFGSTSTNLSFMIYSRRICIVNEQTGSLFSANPTLSNISKVMIYRDDNQSNWSFRNDNKPCINYTSNTSSKLRLELKYLNGDVINRYVDTLLNNGTVRICANPDPTTHYEQLIVSATEKPTSLRNVYANCLVGEDYTRFVYQSSNILKAYTTEGQYYLYTYDGTTKVYLASMDGTISSYYNLDVLEFNQNPTTFDITGDVVSFEHNNNELTIFYYNLDNNSEITNIRINRVNDSTLYFNVNETDTPNRFIVYFDYDTLNISNTSLLRITVTSYLEDGTTRQTIKYFNTQGKSGQIPNELGFILAILTTIFGLTLTVVRISLGWFGIVTQLLSLILLSFTTGAWFITLLMGVNFIILIFIVLLFVNQNYAAVA